MEPIRLAARRAHALVLGSKGPSYKRGQWLFLAWCEHFRVDYKRFSLTFVRAIPSQLVTPLYELTQKCVFLLAAAAFFAPIRLTSHCSARLLRSRRRQPPSGGHCSQETRAVPCAGLSSAPRPSRANSSDKPVCDQLFARTTIGGDHAVFVSTTTLASFAFRLFVRWRRMRY